MVLRLTDPANPPAANATAPIYDVKQRDRICDLLDAGHTATWDEHDEVPDWFLVSYDQQLAGLHAESPYRVRARYLSLTPDDIIQHLQSQPPQDKVFTTSGRSVHLAQRNDNAADPNWHFTTPFPLDVVRSVPSAKTQLEMYQHAFPQGLPHIADRELLPLIQSPRIKHLTLPTNRNYTEVATAVMNHTFDRLVVTGPTGTGKSTFAAVNMIQGFQTLFLLPTEANIASMIEEYHNVMPKAISSGTILNDFTKEPLRMPSSSYTSLSANLISSTQITFVTYAQFCDFVLSYCDLPPHHIILMDEYHLTSSLHAVLARNILMHVERSQPTGIRTRRIFVSATPMFTPPPAPVTGNIVDVALPEPLPDLYAQPVSPFYQPASYRNFISGAPMLQVLAESTHSAETLASELSATGTTAYSVTANTSFDQAQSAFSSGFSEKVIITTPETSIGTTFRINVLLNPNLVSVVVFEKGVVYTARLPNGESGTIQGRGRAGRVLQTQYFFCPTVAANIPETTSLPIMADTILYLTYLTGDILDSQESRPALAAYPKLKILTTYQALTSINRATEDNSRLTSPFLRSYECDAMGAVYTENGGTAPGFATHNAPSFRLFTWPQGQAYAAFLNLNADHNIAQASTPAIATAVSQVLSARAGTTNTTLAQLTPFILNNPARYMQDILTALTTLSNNTGDAVRRSAVQHQTFEYMYGHDVATLLTSLGPGRVKLTLTPTQRANDLIRTVTIKVPQAQGRPITTTLRYHCPNTYRQGNLGLIGLGSVNGSRVAQHLFDQLRPTFMGAVIQDDPNLTTDLSTISHLQRTCQNNWFKQLQL